MATLKISFILFFLIGVNYTFAQIDDLDKIYADIISKYDDIATFTADFTQNNYWSEPDLSQKSNGKIIYNSEKLLLSYSDPEGQKMIVDSISITLYDPNSNQVMISNKTGQSIHPIELIKYYWNISKKEFHQDDNELITVKMDTKDGQKFLIKIQDNLVIFIELSDEEKNSVSYTFTNIETNAVLGESIFNFEIPDEANVIDTRK
jgi:outer membrane lipoprotein-sorting protein